VRVNGPSVAVEPESTVLAREAPAEASTREFPNVGRLAAAGAKRLRIRGARNHSGREEVVICSGITSGVTKPFTVSDWRGTPCWSPTCRSTCRCCLGAYRVGVRDRPLTRPTSPCWKLYTVALIADLTDTRRPGPGKHTTDRFRCSDDDGKAWPSLYPSPRRITLRSGKRAEVDAPR